MSTDPRLLDDAALERSSVVANNAMNRGRGLSGVNSYARDLGFDPFAVLAERLPAPVRWIDVCCGAGRALLEAEERFAAEYPAASVALLGVDLVGYFQRAPRSSRLRLVTASAHEWRPEGVVDLVTCVHGLHYIGDKLALLTAMAGWLAPGGILAAHFDPGSIRHRDGSAAARPVLAELRRAGMDYDSRRHLVTARGPAALRFPATYLGADDTAGPGYTGQPAVTSHYTF
ncbi:class I SAM-dependent methyltransferase [Nocardia harenae]|uniref:class I SAM-dependent methyltransferase n=1 Tax=Nocardia harenae TaxID=358707 RepID=UPI001FE03431|nr:class I SAM-dependent methyltransferase [Nocardia harenae]